MEPGYNQQLDNSLLKQLNRQYGACAGYSQGKHENTSQKWENIELIRRLLKMLIKENMKTHHKKFLIKTHTSFHSQGGTPFSSYTPDTTLHDPNRDRDWTQINSTTQTLMTTNSD
jgi:hypothetical protein